MKTRHSVERVELLKSELSRIRHESLLATRQNDYRKIALLTTQTAQLNKALREIIADQQVEDARFSGALS